MADTKEIALFISLIVLAILFLVVIIAFNFVSSRRKLIDKEQQWQKELIRGLVQAKETQTTKIATDLHNLIIPVLTLSALNLNAKLTELEHKGLNLTAAKSEVEELGKIIENIRQIAHGIIPSMFNSFGVVKSIENVVRQLGSVDGKTAIFTNCTDYVSDLPFSTGYQLTIYNACLEILNNLRKHGNYKGLTVNFERNGNFLQFVFSHDGKGITNEEIRSLAKSKKGIGLLSLESLAIALEGEIDYKKEIGISTVTLKFPLKNQGND